MRHRFARSFGKDKGLLSSQEALAVALARRTAAASTIASTAQALAARPAFPHDGPGALRPHISVGLPFSEHDIYSYTNHVSVCKERRVSRNLKAILLELKIVLE